MRGRTLAMLATGAWLGACGGGEIMNIRGDAGGSSSGGSTGASSGSGGSSSGGSGSGGSSGGNSSSGNSSGGGSDAGDGDMGAPDYCDGGLVSCAGICVDTQMDPNNCGGCGVLCTGGTCQYGVCNLVGECDGGVHAAGSRACIAVDQQNVYVATDLTGEVYKVPLSGGCPQTLVANQASPHGIASDGTNVFWAAAGSGQIWKSDTNGGNARAIVSGQTGPFNIAVDADGVYWNNASYQNPTPISVWRADKDGSNVKQLYHGSLTRYVVGGYVAVDATRVYFPDVPTGTIFSVEKTGSGAAVPLATGQGDPYGIAVDATTLFWTNFSGGVMALDLKPNSTPKTLAMGAGVYAPEGIATDGTSVFWSDGYQFGEYTGLIQKVPVGGGATTRLASSQDYPDCVAVDSTSVFWINSDSSVSKTGK